MPIAGLFKPEYLLNPGQLLRRIVRGVVPTPPGPRTARLPGGWPIEVTEDDDIGRSLVRLGVYELAVSETLWRLCDPGETALDLGANIGIMSALLARAVGPSGRVLSFEAHPVLASELGGNVARWNALAGAEVIRVHELALSDREGTISLEVPPGFAQNRGISRVVADGSGVAVACAPLDRFLADVPSVGVAKMDVEGHEEAVLRGAGEALARGLVRDWVFESHEDYPTSVTALLEGIGYTVLQIEKTFFRPALVPMTRKVARSAWEPQNYLATRDPGRAEARLSKGGWQVMRPAPARAST